MASSTPTITISGADNHTTPTTATTIPIPTSRHQTRPQTQTQKQAQTTTAFIFHVSTLVYRPRSTGSPSSISTNSNGTNSDSTSWSPISVSDSSSISGYTSSGSDSTWNQNIIINPTKSQSHHHHPNPLRQHTVLLPRPSAGETIAQLQAVGIPFVIIWEPETASSGYGGDDGFDNEFASEEEVANTISRVLGLKDPICPMKVVGRWTLLRSVAAQGQHLVTNGKDGKKGGNEEKEVTGTLVIGDDEERNREMARMLGFQAERVVNAEEVERMWGRREVVEEERKEEDEEKGEVNVVVEKEDLGLKQNQTQGQHLKPTKPTLSLRSRLSCPFDDMKVVEGLCFSPEDKIDEESTEDDGVASEKQAGFEENKEGANKGGHTESPTSTTPSTPDIVQGQYIPVKHSERTVAYVPVSPTSTTSSEKDFESPVTRITSIIFFSPPSLKTWDRDVRVVSKLCQSQGDGEEVPKLYIVQKPGELGSSNWSLSSSSSSPLASSASSITPSPTSSTSPSESSLDTLTTTASTVFSQASSTSSSESVPSKRQFKLTMPRTASDWIRDVTTHWRATNPNLSDKTKLPYYLIDPLTCALQVLEIGRQRAQSTIWARANLPVHLRQVLRLETLYVVDSGEHSSRLFNDLNSAKGGGDSCSKDKHSASASADPDPDLSFQWYLASLGVEVIPAKRCRRIGMSNVYALEKRVQKLGYVCRPLHSSKPEPLQDEDQNTKKVHENKDSGDTSARQPTTQTHQRRTSWFRQLITRGQPRSSKSRSPGAGGQSQTQRPSTSTSTNKTRKHHHHTKHTNHSNNSTTNLTINSTNIPPTNIPTGIPRSMTTPNNSNAPTTATATTAKFTPPAPWTWFRAVPHKRQETSVLSRPSAIVTISRRRLSTLSIVSIGSVWIGD